MSVDFAALIGSRICHDLVSPLGAIANGVELLAMSPGGGSPELELIASSVEEANARILLFRVAFGGASDYPVEPAEIRSILAPLSGDGKFEIDWQVAGAVPRAELKLACLALMTVQTALPRGARISVGGADGRWRIEASGDRLDPSDALWRPMISDDLPVDALTAGRVHVPLTRIAAAELGRAPDLDLREAGLTLTI